LGNNLAGGNPIAKNPVRSHSNAFQSGAFWKEKLNILVTNISKSINPLSAYHNFKPLLNLRRFLRHLSSIAFKAYSVGV
jgi:hypothetical protein